MSNKEQVSHIDSSGADSDTINKMQTY